MKLQSRTLKAVGFDKYFRDEEKARISGSLISFGMRAFAAYTRECIKKDDLEDSREEFEKGVKFLSATLNMDAETGAYSLRRALDRTTHAFKPEWLDLGQ